MKIAAFFAEGFEEVEAILPLNLFKRAGCDVTMIGVYEDVVESAREVKIQMNTTLESWDKKADCFFLPGGVPGVYNLEKSAELKDIIKQNLDADKLICAICAAPVVVLDKWGLISGKKVTCFPGLKDNFITTTYCDENVCVDKNIITSKGVGTVFPFAFAIIENLFDVDKVLEVKKSIYYS